VADRRQSSVDIWRPYAAPGPARQLPARARPPRQCPGRSGRVHSLLPLSLSPETRPQRAPVASSLRRARTRSSLRRSPRNSAHSSTVNCSPFSTHHLAVKPTGEPPFLSSPKSGHRDLLLRRTQCRALRSRSSSLVRS